jgi:glucosamine--fructose-6-phosphate aminotransferase (isomerizing)
MTAGKLMAQEMAQQPAVLGRLVEGRSELIARIRDVLPPTPVRVAVVARGSSDNAAVFGRYVLEHAARTPVAISAPSLQTRYAIETDYRGFLAVAVSQSGRTPEIVHTLARMRERGAVAVAITNDATSPLAQAAELVIDLQAGLERAVPATKTVTAQLAALALLAEAIGPVPWAASDWATVVAAVEAVLGDSGPVTAIADALADEHGLIAIARGYLLAAALETALKVTETTSMLAQGYSAVEFRHGPIGVVGGGLPVVALSAPGPCERDVMETAHAVRERGGQVHALESGQATAWSGAPEALAAIPAVVRGQQLAHALAVGRGVDPDAPAGLSKVTATV